MLWVTPTLQTIRSIIGANYDIKFVAPKTTFDCVKDGSPTTVDGNSTPALGFCTVNGRPVFVFTTSAIESTYTDGKIVNVWYLFTINSAMILFGLPNEQDCAAGYVIARRPGYNHTADLDAFKTMVYGPDIPAAAPPWEYILTGMNLVKARKPISDCANAAPTS